MGSPGRHSCLFYHRVQLVEFPRRLDIFFLLFDREYESACYEYDYSWVLIFLFGVTADGALQGLSRGVSGYCVVSQFGMIITA